MQGRIDAINDDSNEHVWLVYCDGSAYSEWTELDKDTSEVVATTWGEDRIDVSGKSGEIVLHKCWTSAGG